MYPRGRARAAVGHLGGVDADAGLGHGGLDRVGLEELGPQRPQAAQCGEQASTGLLGALGERDDPAAGEVAVVGHLLDALGGNRGEHGVAAGGEAFEEGEAPGRVDEDLRDRLGEVAVGDLGEADVAEVHVLAEEGEPVLVGADGTRGVVRDPVNGELTVADVAEVGMDHILVHDSHRTDPSLAFELAHLDDGNLITQTPIGILRNIECPTYDDQARTQVQLAAGDTTDQDSRDVVLATLLTGNGTWQV